MATAKPRTVQSVDKAMELLEVLLKNRRPMSLQELSQATGYPKSTLHALLTTLRCHEAVRQNEDGRYALGIRLFEYGCAVSGAWDITHIAHPYLERLAALSGASAFLASMDGSNAIALDQCAAGGGLQVVPDIGSRLPLHATSQGKLLLSQLPDSEVLKRTQGTMQAFTPHTITEPQKLLSALHAIREDGYAVEDGEYKIGLRSVSAPVWDRYGRPQYALGVVGLFRRVASPEFQDAIYRVRETASQLSELLKSGV